MTNSPQTRHSRLAPRASAAELLVERAEQGRDLAHETILKTPTTLPSTCT